MVIDKQKQREELEKQILEFLAKGGQVKQLDSKANPVQRKVT